MSIRLQLKRGQNEITVEEHIELLDNKRECRI